MITVTAAIIRQEGKILAAQRAEGGHLSGSWEFPGGKVEANETNRECLRRELHEELGIQCFATNLFSDTIYDYGDKRIRLFTFFVKHLSGTITCHVHKQITWLLPDELLSIKWAPADVEVAKKLQLYLATHSTL